MQCKVRNLHQEATAKVPTLANGVFVFIDNEERGQRYAQVSPNMQRPPV
jgi:hypothetical protein